MSNAHIILFISASILAGCSQQQPLVDTDLPPQSTPTNTWGTTYATDTAAVGTTTTGSAANGAMLTGIDPLNAVSDCNVDPLLWGEPITTFGNMAWNFRMGGAISQDILDVAAASLDPIDNFMGGELTSDMFIDPVSFVTYAFEVDNSMNVLLDASDNGTNIPAANMLSAEGLTHGYHIAWVPWIFSFTPGTAPLDPSYMEVGTVYLSLFLGVNPSNNLTPAIINGVESPSALQVHLGLPTWTGDTTLTNEFCTITYFLDGQSITPL